MAPTWSNLSLGSSYYGNDQEMMFTSNVIAKNPILIDPDECESHLAISGSTHLTFRCRQLQWQSVSLAASTLLPIW